MMCKKCESGYSLDINLGCKCARGIISCDDPTSECIPDPDSDSKSQDEEDSISEIQKQRGEMVQFSKTIAASIAAASTGVFSVVSRDSNTLVLYLSTIQILSLLQYLNTNLPFEIRKQQS